ncbi:hypothetical protein UFOVP1053_35 [uncultured Caudovirales phage]|uniref:Uncharacterized protein n=1 Tax=uncultured Caudovirales phage TaxID=2100421 RepID=A0A6J5MFW2_9CAUD|nr:hypothetical protein UFOVP472_35 [uncultured Caudovirales phage]CAB4180775.1 hypothetical protein UFOVP1053_35 [uncultured Caudovirales phage]
MTPALLGYVLQAIQIIPDLIAAGQSVSALIAQTSASLRKMQAENRDPSAEEWAAQAQVINDLRSKLHAA